MRTVLILALVLGTVASACAADDDGHEGGRVAVVAAFYPLAEAVRQVGGDLVDVRDLTPSGAEPHDLETTTDDVDAIEDADVVVLMGRGFQPSVEDAAKHRDGQTLRVLDELT